MVSVKKLYALVAMSMCVSVFVAYSQVNENPELPQDREPRMARMERPSTFELVSEIRDSIGLDSKEFDKVYSAYSKYEKKVYGDSGQQTGMPRPPHDMNHHGMPGGGMGMPPGQHGRMGHDGGFPPQHPDMAGNPSQKPEDVEKIEKERLKQEENLGKTMKKIFKKEPEKYMLWLEIRDRQLKKLSRPKPHDDMTPPEM